MMETVSPHPPLELPLLGFFLFFARKDLWQKYDVIKNEQAPKKGKPIYDWKRIKKGTTNPAENERQPKKRVQDTDGEKPKD